MIGILPYQHILELIEQDGIIQNASTDCISSASYELRVGSFRIPGDKEATSLADSEIIAMAPHSFLLIGTIETVNLPAHLRGLLYLRSTYARRGFTPWFQGLVDPGYAGGLTIILHNLTNQLVPIVGGERICHFEVTALAEPTQKPYEGQYKNLPGATPAQYGAPVARIVGQRISSRTGPSLGNLPSSIELLLSQLGHLGLD